MKLGIGHAAFRFCHSAPCSELRICDNRCFEVN
jgi:hypothetical protein